MARISQQNLDERSVDWNRYENLKRESPSVAEVEKYLKQEQKLETAQGKRAARSVYDQIAI